MRDRVFSLETEYAITFYAEDDRKPGAGTIVDALTQAVAETHGLPDHDFLLNGSKLAHDVGHAEWALPECRSAREAAAYDKAADHLFIESVVPRAGQVLGREGFAGRLVVAKNNVDPYGATYGCHENYQMKRHADLLTGEDFVRYVAQSLIPFLVSRQILAGSGRLVRVATDDTASARYELAQRSGFIQAVVSNDTTKSRPILNLGREGESFSAGNSRRLHLILGDATLSGWATWIKLGSVGLLLRMIEDLFIGDAPILADPVAAIKAISRDLSGQETVPLQTGGAITALDIQWTYYNQADAYLTLFGASEDDEALMEAWGQALEDFERDPMLLRDRADWAIKKQMLDTFLAARGLSFDDLPADNDLADDLQAFDLRYHELSEEGLYHRLYAADTLLTADEIQRAQEYPPPYTRARIRGEVVRLGRECGLPVETDRWMDATIEDTSLDMADPLRFDHPRLAEWDRPWVTLEKAVEGEPGNAALRHRLGRCYLSLGLYGRARDALSAAVERVPEKIDTVRDLARASLLSGAYDDAIKWYEKYNQLAAFGDDAYFQDYNSLGDAYRHQGDFAKAIKHYRKGTRTSAPRAALAYHRIAQAHLKSGEIQSAETHFRKSLRSSRERLISWVGLGAILRSQNEREQAQTCFADALTLSQNRATLDMTVSSARYVQAVARIGLEQEDALDALRAALENQTAEAADGIFLLEPLLTLLAQAQEPPRHINTAIDLARDIRLRPAPDAPPPMLERRRAWLESALTHPSAEVRAQAVEALRWRIDAERLPALESLIALLIDRAHHDPEASVRRAAVQALAHPALVGMNVMDELIACLRDECPAVRWAAQTGLEQLSQPSAALPVMTELAAAVSDRSARREELIRRLLSATADPDPFDPIMES